VNQVVQYRDTSKEREEALDRAFAALADPTRRKILGRLGQGPRTISELAETFAMSLTGMKKHVQVLEGAGLVESAKVGRVRTCRLGRERLDDVNLWIAMYRSMLEQRLDSLEAFLERTKEGTS
jgi:DNA-binding transcriptional ArsR family regulator